MFSSYLLACSPLPIQPPQHPHPLSTPHPSLICIRLFESRTTFGAYHPSLSHLSDSAEKRGEAELIMLFCGCVQLQCSAKMWEVVKNSHGGFQILLKILQKVDSTFLDLLVNSVCTPFACKEESSLHVDTLLFLSSWLDILSVYLISMFASAKFG